MASPSSALSTQRPDIASSFMEFDLAAQRANMIAGEVFPVIETAKQAGNFGKISIEQLLQHPETQRAPGGPYNRASWTFAPATYSCVEHGIEEPVDDNEATMYAEYFDAEMMAGVRAYHAVLMAYELRTAAAVFNATTWTSYTTSAGSSLEWSDYANALPLNNIETAVQAVYSQSGIWPNALIINRKVFRNLRNCAQIIDRVKYQGFVDARAGNITAEAIGQACDLRLIVAGGTQNTANEGQDASLSPAWSNEYAMVCKVAETSDPREPCIGRTFHWGEDGSEVGGHVESYRDETVRSDIIRVRHQVDELVLYPEVGHLIDNITE